MFRSLHMKLMLIMTLLIISIMTVVGAVLVNSVSGFYLEQFYSQMPPNFSMTWRTPPPGRKAGRSSWGR